MMLSRFLPFLFLLLYSCKKTPSPPSEPAPVAKPATIGSLEKELTELKNKHLEFSPEFDLFQAFVLDYQKTDAYENPSTDTQIFLAAIAELLPYISKQRIQELILQKQFQLFEGRLDSIDRINRQAQDLLMRTSTLVAQGDGTKTPSEEDMKNVVRNNIKNQPEPAAATEPPGPQSPPNPSPPPLPQPSPQGENPNKPYIIASGAFLLILGAVGLAEWGYQRLPTIYAEGRKAYMERFVHNVFFKDLPFFGKFAYFIFVGILLVSKSTPSEADLIKAEELFFLMGVVFGVVAIYYGIELWANTLGRDWLQKSLGEVKYDPKKYYHYNFAESFSGSKQNWLPAGSEELKPIREGENLKGWQTLKGLEESKLDPSTFRTPREGKIRATMTMLGASSAAILSILWEQKALNLDDKKATPEMEFVYRIARFYRVCELLSEKGVLVLN